MNGHEYEKVVAQYLINHGYKKVTVTRGSGDFGVDVVAQKGNKKYAVQCKYYSNPVSLNAVQEVFAGKAYYGCDVAMVVTNNTFTQAARELATLNGVILIDKVSGSECRSYSMWLKILAFLYALVVVMPVTALLFELVSKSPSLKNVFEAICGFLMITVPLWGVYAIKRIYLWAKRKISLRNAKKCNAPLRLHSKTELASPIKYDNALLEKTPLINVEYVKAQLGNDGCEYIAKEALDALSDKEFLSAPKVQHACCVSYSLACIVLKTLVDKGFLVQIEEHKYTWTEKSKLGGDNHAR